MYRERLRGCFRPAEFLLQYSLRSVSVRLSKKVVVAKSTPGGWLDLDHRGVHVGREGRTSSDTGSVSSVYPGGEIRCAI